MTKININDLQAGMVLKQAVFHSGGGLLLNEGVTLTEKHIRVFRQWGVTDVQIHGEEMPDPEQSALVTVPDEIIKEIEEHLASRFSLAKGDSVMTEIMEITKKIRLQEWLKKNTANGNRTL
jgi:hypothetical protein